jgi:hypothetical protein
LRGRPRNANSNVNTPRGNGAGGLAEDRGAGAKGGPGRMGGQKRLGVFDPATDVVAVVAGPPFLRYRSWGLALFPEG